ncbi:MAG: hypothetical protein H7Y31_09495 [Chitinophagaceae bacterium]|nr:hypothetical protein [Chitinophagaceae bacterium]
MRLLLVCLFFFIGSALFGQRKTSLGTNNSFHNDSVRNECMENAHRLLDEAFKLMQRNYYRKDVVNWDTLKLAATTKLNSRGVCNDAYETINWCFQQMRENHSFIMPTLKAAEYNNDRLQLTSPTALSKMVGSMRSGMINDSVAYLTIPWVSTTDEEVCNMIADSIQSVIETLDRNNVKKWIVDIRKNTGGNCWPMIAGAGPLLGEGICGYFVRNNEKVSITYKNGMAMQGKYTRCKVSRKPYQLKNPNSEIVILTANSTASSGEIIALAFKGKSNVQFVGEATAGFTTANATYTLSDNSMLVLTVCQEADRDGKIYSGRLIPDIPIASNISQGKDAILDAAVQSAPKK